MTLYMLTRDSAGNSTCYDQCAQEWPPYTVPNGSIVYVPDNLNISSIGILMRADGSIQMTYNGMPLYFYAQDTQPGDTKGQGVEGVWFVVQP
jgi:predicted lipoprotein with Yx(FWY)xxD motif